MTFYRLRCLVALPALAGVLAGSAPAAEPARVVVEAGNIVMVEGSDRRQLTRSGLDDEPVLTPDGKSVVFTRLGKARSANDDGQFCPAESPDELRRINLDGKDEEVLVRGRSSDKPPEGLCGFQRKQFTSDGRSLYFMSPAWAVSAALHVYTFHDKGVRYVMPANDVIVLSACESKEHRDALVVGQHRYFVTGGSYDWYWLYDRTGRKEIAPLGEHDSEQAVLAAIKDSALCTR